MKRRSALRGLICAGLLPANPVQALAEAGAKTLARMPDIKARFAAALKKAPALLGYASAKQADYHTPRTKRLGQWPAELKGSLYRNGPARHEIGSFRYQHWFDGDGMLQAFHLGANRIEHRARMIRTRKYLDEEAAGRALYPGFGTNPPAARGTPSADQLNPANISVLAHHNQLFALWEAGSPYQMNPDTLETMGEHRFSDATQGVPFSAHPRVEPDGTLWNFGYASSLKKLVLWHLNAAGGVVKTGLVDCDPISMVHDFVVTSRHIVLLVCPLHYEETEDVETFLDTHRWQPNLATQVLVIDKNDFARVQRLELPAQWVFHFSNAWEDNAGIIRFEAARAPDPSVLNSTFRDIMSGVITPARQTHLYAYSIDTKRGRVQESGLQTNTSYEFPVVSPHQIGLQHAQLLMLSEQQSPHAGLNSLELFNMRTEHQASYRYPDNLIPEEHLLVGTPDAGGNLPWVMGTALNYQKRRTELHLFNSQAIADGPIASARLPYALPLGLHGKFVSA